MLELFLHSQNVATIRFPKVLQTSWVRRMLNGSAVGGVQHALTECCVLVHTGSKIFTWNHFLGARDKTYKVTFPWLMLLSVGKHNYKRYCPKANPERVEMFSSYPEQKNTVSRSSQVLVYSLINIFLHFFPVPSTSRYPSKMKKYK